MTYSNGLVRAYKLFKKRKDGTYGPAQVEQKNLVCSRYVPGVMYEAEDANPRYLKHRPGFHCCAIPYAPHMKDDMPGRAWCEVLIRVKGTEQRPESQGGLWFLASELLIVREVDGEELERLRSAAPDHAITPVQ